MKKGKTRFGILLLALSMLLSGATAVAPTQTVKAGGIKKVTEPQSAVSATQASDKNIALKNIGSKKASLWDDLFNEEEEEYGYISNMDVDKYTVNSLTLSWYSYGKMDGFHIYRSSEYDKDYVKIGTVKNGESGKHVFTDKTFMRGVKFYYAIVAYYYDADGKEVEFDYVENGYLLDLPKVTLTSATRSGNKVVLKWKKVNEVSGYEIYQKAAGSSYKKVKTINGNATLSATLSGVSTSKQYAFKMRAFTKYKTKTIYGSFGSEKVIYAKADQKVVLKFRQLQKKFPDGRYWNHVGKKKYTSNTITSKPCHHANLDDLRTCNHYNCPNGVLGYQCYGFAWKMSDLIYGRSAKIKNFKGYSKCRMGDVVRYNGHSIIIVEKHSNYVIAGECNYGNTCIIKWGRKVPQLELVGATYSRRYR